VRDGGRAVETRVFGIGMLGLFTLADLVVLGTLPTIAIFLRGAIACRDGDCHFFNLNPGVASDADVDVKVAKMKVHR
jgi:hypothetical protein